MVSEVDKKLHMCIPCWCPLFESWAYAAPWAENAEGRRGQQLFYQHLLITHKGGVCDGAHTCTQCIRTHHCPVSPCLTALSHDSYWYTSSSKLSPLFYTHSWLFVLLWGPMSLIRVVDWAQVRGYLQEQEQLTHGYSTEENVFPMESSSIDHPS